MRVLLVEDNDGDADLVADALGGFLDTASDLARVDRLQAAADRLRDERFDVVLLDLSLPDATGLDGLRRLVALAPDAPVVVLTGSVDAAVGTQAIQGGAQDYLQKGQVKGPELWRAIQYARERAHYAYRSRFLSEIGAALGGALEPELMIAALRDALLKEYADWFGVDGAAEATPHDGAEKPAAPLAPQRARLFASLAAHGPGDGEPARVEDLRRSGICSAMIVPFRAKGWTHGALTFGRRSAARAYGPADLALAEDITRRLVTAVEYAALLVIAQRERDRAEVATRVRDEFLATLSHELRTPLNSILGWTQLLRTKQVAEEKQQKALETIERNARSQVAIIEDVLDVSRIITGKIRLKIAPVDLAQVLATALETIRPAADAKKIQLSVTPGLATAMVQADPDRLLQVLWNLLSNAVKFTGSGGKVLVQLDRDEAAIHLAVTDTGHGIAPDFLPHVFERFRQADGTATRRHGGLGLGLAIARHLTELQGGTLRAESEGLGKGATFLLRVPIAPHLGAATPDSVAPARGPWPGTIPAPAPALAGLRILVVDDDADTRTLISVMLESSGALVSTADSAKEGLAALRAEKHDILVSDIGMPEASGYELIQHVRALPLAEGGATPAVALTAYTRAEDRMLALRLGFDQHITKPVEPLDLMAVLASLGRRKLDASGAS